MKSKIILGLATLVGLALPSFAAQTYCSLDRDGDSQICVTSGYDAYGHFYQRRFTRPVYNRYYGSYGNGFFNGNRSYREYDRNAYRRREHEEHERRERSQREYREHHRDYDRDHR
jgi:hypothetical protein